MSLSSVYANLEAASNDRNPSQVKAAIREAKLALLQSNLLILNTQQSGRDVEQARTILESCALLSLQVNDVASFERFIAQLTPFYSHPSLSKSPLRPRLTGLYLLLLLSRNEIGSFHTLIETLSADVDSQLMQDQLVKFPIELEKCLMEGSFTKIWNASNEPPSPEYKVFLQDLMATVRNEIASCGEKAYTTLPIRDAATLLFYTELNDVLAFASKRKGWIVNPTTQIISFTPLESKSASNTLMDREKIIQATLGYAQELETIV